MLLFGPIVSKIDALLAKQILAHQLERFETLVS